MRDPAWAKLKYINSTKLLLGMDKIFDASGLKKHRHASDILLDRRIRDIAEDRRCAIFCHGAGQALGTEILFSPYEHADYDYVGAFKHNGRIHTFPIQLKQLVPDRLNPITSLQREISKLVKYADAENLVVAFHINRKIHMIPQELDVSNLKVKELWLYGCLQDQANCWLLFGNLMSASPHAYTFQLPGA